MMSRCNA